MPEIEIFEEATKGVDEGKFEAIKVFLENNGAERELLNSFAELMESKTFKQVGVIYCKVLNSESQFHS